MKPFLEAPLFTRLLSLSIIFSGISAFADETELVEIESIDGRKITVELIEKSKDKVKIKHGLKIYTLSFDKLSDDSAALVKGANIPPICDFALVGDFTKRTKTHRSSKKVSGDKGEMIDVHSSYKRDTVSGKVVVKNDDTMDHSPAAQLTIVVFAKDENRIFALNQVSHAVPEIAPLKSLEFSVGEASASHSQRGDSFNFSFGTTKGRYYGYIAIVSINDRIVAVKSIPATYERDPEAAKKFLGGSGRPLNPRR